jgi:antirestriction protein ArdC
VTRRGYGNATSLGRISSSQRVLMKRDSYAEVSTRIIAELEAGAAPWIKPWSATPGANTPCNAATNRPYSGCNVVLLWMAQAAGYRTPRYLTFKQALELGGHVRKGERGTRVYFVKQFEVRDDADEAPARLIPTMREYTVFNVDQCENLPDSVNTGRPMRVRNPDTRDELADAFLCSTGADIREGHGEACYIPSRDFISMPAFAGFSGADAVPLILVTGTAIKFVKTRAEVPTGAL